MKLLLLLLIPCSLNSQKIKHGTLIIACIAKDGIVIGADSRLTDVYRDNDGKNKPKSYEDNCQKIFFVHQIPMAIAGAYSFGSEYSYLTIKRYNELETGDNEFISSDKIHYFLTNIMNEYNLQQNSNFLKNEFISGGYLEGKPRIFMFRNIQGKIKSFISGTQYQVSDDDALKVFYKNYDSTKTYSTKQCATIIKKTITFFGKHFKRTVGGKVQIVIIDSENNSKIYQNDFSKKPLGDSLPNLIPPKDSIFYREIYNSKF